MREFRESNVGPIPTDWSVRPFLAAVRIATGQVDPRAEPYRDMVLIAPDHLESRTGRLLMKRTAAEQGAISGKYLFGSGDIVYSKIRPYLRKAVIATFDGLCSADMYPLRPADDVCARFMLAVILGERFSRYVDSESMRSGIPKVNREQLAGFSLALPPPDEQEAISAALLDADELLNELGRLINKKRDMRAGTVQRLLTGVTRLSGFDRDWDERRLDAIADIDPEALSGKTAPDYSFRYIALDDVERGRLRAFSTERFATAPSRARRRLRDGDILFGTVRPNLQSHLLFGSTDDDWICSTGFAVIRCKPGEALAQYVFPHLFAGPVTRQIRSLLAGSSYPAISGSDVRGLTIPVPEIDEQRAIAAVISDMDAEIAALEQRRDKVAAIREGMSQALVSGRVAIQTREPVTA